MASESQNPTDFLRFSAYSMKDLITRKLSEDTRFTDQVYEGSNLAVLIDIVSYMYQCLLYQLNNAASESMFSDTQIYENISRLCRFIGYHPSGVKPATIDMIVSQAEGQTGGPIVIPEFLTLDTGLTDGNGNQIYFSTDYVTDNTTENDSLRVNLTNGKWNLYSTIFSASGENYETFVLDQVGTTQPNGLQTSEKHVRVWTKRDGTFHQWKMDTEEILANKYQQDDIDGTPSFSKLYTNSDQVYSSYLDQNGRINIKFGNGIVGKKLLKGELLYVFYLETNGLDGYINLNNVVDSSLEISRTPQQFGMTSEDYYSLFSAIGNSDNAIQNLNQSDYEISLDRQSMTIPKQAEGVEEIRENAPDWFKTGNRLITRSDYQYFVKNGFPGVIDVKCMNNWEYVSTFYKWLYHYGVNPNKYISEDSRNIRNTGPMTYLDQYILESNNYMYVDAADACNVYLWTKLDQGSGVTDFNQSIDSKLSPIKTLTTEIYAIPPVDVEFSICASPEDVELAYVRNGLVNDSYLEITIDDNSIYVAPTIQMMVANVLKDYFDATNCRIGQVVDYQDMLGRIFAINGVTRVRTIYNPEDDANYFAVDGLSFSSYSSQILERGEDLQVSNVSKKLQDFQFPTFGIQKSRLVEKIKVIKRQLSTASSPIKF